MRGDGLAAIGLRHEAVERGTNDREALRPIDAQIARVFVDLVLLPVGWDDLDVGGHDLRTAFARGEPVPGVRPVGERLFHRVLVARAKRNRACPPWGSAIWEGIERYGG